MSLLALALKGQKGAEKRAICRDGAAPESNRASVGLPHLTGFEDRLGHRARAAPKRECRAKLGSGRLSRSPETSPHLTLIYH